MILEISVKNISLIPALTLAPDEGLSILTGETGAGKSILLGALSLLLGERASVDLIRADCDTATVEGLFRLEMQSPVHALLEESGLEPCEDNQLVIKRTLARNGRSKCFINGGYTTLAILERIGEELVDLHGQHQHQSLLQRHQQRDLLDAWAGLETLRKQVADVYGELRASRAAREQLAMDEAERVRQLDLLVYQIEEIEKARIQPGEYEQLQEEKNKLANAERMLANVITALDSLHRKEEGSARESLTQAVNAISDLARFDSQMGSLADDLRSAEVLITDVVDRLADFSEGFEADPAQLETVEERLDVLYKLKKKYGESEEAILGFYESKLVEKESLTHKDEELERLAQEEAALSADLSQKARELSGKRRAAGKELAKALELELKSLGFNQAMFEIQVEPREDTGGWISWDGKHYKCGPHGADDIQFLIAPNPGEEAKPVSKIASGGELSRIMLAIKVIAASAARVPTMIFDEVDAGVGGATAEAVGRKLKELSKHRQVMVITHLPQIARFARSHFLISKYVEQGRTISQVSPLDRDAQVKELARLMAGDQITDTALNHARELIEKS
ncbi:DNA repair protein RecN [bacterium]|nr:DNA repair protein RecN [bacterium]